MGKSKKNKDGETFSVVVPAYDCFCGFDMQDEPYKWHGWGLVIRHLRDYANMDQTVFGRLLQGYTRGQIARYETEQTEPPIDFWVKMSYTFGLNIHWALTGTGEPYILEHQNCPLRKRFYEWIELISNKENFLKELEGWR